MRPLTRSRGDLSGAAVAAAWAERWIDCASRSSVRMLLTFLDHLPKWGKVYCLVSRNASMTANRSGILRHLRYPAGVYFPGFRHPAPGQRAPSNYQNLASARARDPSFANLNTPSTSATFPSPFLCLPHFLACAVALDGHSFCVCDACIFRFLSSRGSRARRRSQGSAPTSAYPTGGRVSDCMPRHPRDSRCILYQTTEEGI